MRDVIVDADTVLARSIAALGSAEAVAAVRSVRGLANCQGPRGEYTTLVESMRGDLLRFQQRWADGRQFVGLVNGAAAWAVDPDSGETEALSAGARAGIRSHEFQLLPIVIGERYADLDIAEQGADEVTLAATDELGLPCRLRFSADSGLLTGMTFDNYNAPGSEVSVLLGRWLEVDGVLFPSLAVATDTAGDWVLDFDRIEVNVVDEGIFATP